MKFRVLAEYFDRLEETASRLSLIDILTELFSAIKDAEELRRVSYLIQGRIAPFFEPVEMGMADKTVASAIANVFGYSKEEVLDKYAKIGDMGVVVQQLSEKVKNVDKGYSINEVFDVLVGIAGVSGGGTVERRIELLSRLFRDLDVVSVKHLTRIVLGRMRLGIGDPTVLDGLALAFLKDRGMRKFLEKAYNETSDLGLIGMTLMEGGLEKVKRLKVMVGRPIRSELCERLPNALKVFEKMDEGGGGVHVTYKYDGFRVQIHKNGDRVSMFSRNLENMSNMFPELIEGVLKQVKARSVILDSEALAYQPDSEEFLPFQETTKRRRKHNIEEVAKSLPLRAFVFDILYVDGESLMEKTLLERMDILGKVIAGDEILIPSKGQVIKKSEVLQLMLEDAISKGLEGVVVKRVDSFYVAGGRNFNWVKLKRHSAGELHDTIDGVILGYIYGKGKRTAFGAGALLVGVYDEIHDEFVSVTKIGTGLTDEEWISIKERVKGLEVAHRPARVNSQIEPSVWVKPEIVIEILADEITRSPIHTAGMEEDGEGRKIGYALRFPRLVSFRDRDKRAEDATSVSELKVMFEEQGKR